MKYAIIQRQITDAYWTVRILESGVVEKLCVQEDYVSLSEDELSTVFEYNGTKYFWKFWASAAIWNKVWIKDEDNSLGVISIHYFKSVEEMFRELSGLN